MGLDIGGACGGGEFGKRRLYIRRRCGRIAHREAGLQPVGVEEIAAGALRRWQREVRIGEHPLEQAADHATRGGPGAAVVIGLAGVPPAPVIQQRVAGAAIEPDRRAVRAQCGQVAHAAEVEHGDGLAGAAEHGTVERRHQRRALTSCGDIAAAQVGDHVDAAQFGQQRRAVQLHRVAGAVELARPVAHRLAVRTDRTDLRARCAAGRKQGLDDVRVAARQRVAGERGAVQLVGAGAVQRQQLVGESRRERSVRVGDDPQRIRARPGEVRQHAVDAVERGAGHQADVELSHRRIVPTHHRRRPAAQDLRGSRRAAGYSAYAPERAIVSATSSWPFRLLATCANAAFWPGASVTASEAFAMMSGSC